MHSTPIYIIDDDDSFCKSLRRLLKARGYTADCFSSARSFLEAVPHSQKEGVAIVDIHMPECDGFALMDKMKEMEYSMPVIVITGKYKSNSESLAMERMAAGFLQKPFSEISLISIIDKTIDEKKL